MNNYDIDYKLRTLLNRIDVFHCNTMKVEYTPPIGHVIPARRYHASCVIAN